MVAKIVEDKLERINELCRTNQVETLSAFGSAVNDQLFSETSDIDLVVTIEVSDPLEKGEKLMSLWNNLELLFQRKVDLLTESSLKNPYLIDSINKTKVKIYDRSGEKVFI